MSGWGQGRTPPSSAAAFASSAIALERSAATRLTSPLACLFFTTSTTDRTARSGSRPFVMAALRMPFCAGVSFSAAAALIDSVVSTRALFPKATSPLYHVEDCGDLALDAHSLHAPDVSVRGGVLCQTPRLRARPDGRVTRRRLARRDHVGGLVELESRENPLEGCLQRSDRAWTA